MVLTTKRLVNRWDGVSIQTNKTTRRPWCRAARRTFGLMDRKRVRRRVVLRRNARGCCGLDTARQCGSRGGGRGCAVSDVRERCAAARCAASLRRRRTRRPSLPRGTSAQAEHCRRQPGQSEPPCAPWRKGAFVQQQCGLWPSSPFSPCPCTCLPTRRECRKQGGAQVSSLPTRASCPNGTSHCGASLSPSHRVDNMLPLRARPDIPAAR